MQIVLVEPFFSGSHKQWALDYQKFSQHDIHLLTLKGRHWKWRLFGGAVSLAKQFEVSNLQPDLFLLSSMTDLTSFRALLPPTWRNTPMVLYFHENQITYPWSPNDPDISLQRNNQYGFINYTSALGADAIFFNSNYHQESFLNGLSTFLRQFPDHKELDNIERIKKKSNVLYLGLDLKALQLENVSKTEKAVLLWNHRWEYDKNPTFFFETLFDLSAQDLPFQLIVLGEQYAKVPAIFEKAKEQLAEHIIHFGYTKDRSIYVQLLNQADILPVSSNQDFFGISIVEAMYCNCIPLLPNRLAYPEHIPKQYHDLYFYEKEEEFSKKLTNWILNIQSLRAHQNISDFVAHYDWSILAVRYDQIFEQITC